MRYGIITTEIDILAKSFLNAPVGYVEQTISDIINKTVYLKVIEQISTSGTKFIRKVVIGDGQFPIVNAVSEFDSKDLSYPVLKDLLEKKESIGNILRKNNIKAERQSVRIEFNRDRKKIIRTYQIVYNNSVWFQVSEDIRLDFLCACKYRGGSHS